MGSVDITCSLCNLLNYIKSQYRSQMAVEPLQAIFAFSVKLCFWLLWPVAEEPHIDMHMHVNGLDVRQAVNHVQHNTAVTMAFLLQKK
jgi:hypothetical protein